MAPKLQHHFWCSSDITAILWPLSARSVRHKPTLGWLKRTFTRKNTNRKKLKTPDPDLSILQVWLLAISDKLPTCQGKVAGHLAIHTQGIRRLHVTSFSMSWASGHSSRLELTNSSADRFLPVRSGRKRDGDLITTFGPQNHKKMKVLRGPSTPRRFDTFAINIGRHSTNRFPHKSVTDPFLPVLRHILGHPHQHQAH